MASQNTFIQRNWPAIVILIAGALARIWWLTEVNTQPQTDFAWYFQRAAELSQNLGYRTEHGHTAYWPPGFSFVLAALFKFTGPSLIAAKVFNAILTLLCGILTCAITYRLIGSRALSCLAGLLVALSPSMIAYSGILASEPLYTFLSLWAIHTVLWAQGYPRWGIAGFLIGLATLVRPQAILLPFALLSAPGPEADYRKPKKRIALALCFILAFTAITPWIIRNARTHHALIFISANGGDNLWIGHNPNATGNYQTPPGIPQSPDQEVANDRSTKAVAMEFIRSDFGHSMSLIPSKLRATFLTPTDITYWAFQTDSTKQITPGMDQQRALFLAAKQATQIFTVTLLIAAGIGTLLGIATPSGRLLVRVAFPQILLTAIIVSIFFGNGRFALPTIPFQVMLAIAGLATIREWAGRNTPPDPDHYGYPPIY
ncbi:MAG: ArnT family glycosyltransferase [Fimbriimonadaceae bacterium]